MTAGNGGNEEGAERTHQFEQGGVALARDECARLPQ
jgi:hypothetical protein